MIVRSRIDPILGQWERVDADPQSTISDLAARVVLPDESLRSMLQVTINGNLIYRRFWHLTRPFIGCPDHPVIVDFQIPLSGRQGGGGGAKILSSIAAIALIGASFLAPGGAFAIGGLFKAGSLSAKLLGAALAMGGSLLMQNLQKPQGASAETKTIGTAGANNDFAPGSGLPRVIGTHKVFPKLVVPPYTTINGDDQYVIAVYGLAGHHQVTDLKNGEVPIENGEDIEIETRNGSASELTALTLIDDTVIETPISLRMSEHQLDPDDNTEGRGRIKDQETPSNSLPRYHRVRTRKDPYRFVVHFLFERGLAMVGTDDPGPGGVWIRGRFRQVGESSWFGLPRMLVQTQESSNLFRVRVEFRWITSIPNTSSSVWPVGTDGDTEYGAHGWAGLQDEPTEDVPVGWYTRLTNGDGDVYYAGIRLNDDQRNLIFYLDESIYPQGTYEFEFQRSRPVNSQGYNIDTDEPDHYFSYLEDDGYWTHTDPQDFAHTISIPHVQSIWPEHPIDYDVDNPATLIAVKARNMQLDRVSCIASGVLTGQEIIVVSGQPASPDGEVSSNPAVWYYHVLTGIHNAEPTSESLIDIAGLTEWYNWCADNGKSVNAVVEGKSVFETLQMLALCGWGSPRFGAMHSVVIERVREDGPIGMITQRNATRFGISKPFSLRPHAVRVTFNDATREYEPREVTIYDEGYNADGSGSDDEATRFESITYEGLVRESLIQDRATHDMKWARHRSTLHHYTQDMEHLEFQKGDLVLMEHDILGTQGRRARITDIEVSSLSEIHSITVDEAVHFGSAEGSVFGEDWFDIDSMFDMSAPKHISMRLVDGSIQTEEVKYATPDHKTLEFIVPFVMPTSGGRDLIEVGALIATGPSTQVARPVLIWDIQPGPDMTASIIAVDYAAAEMYLSGGGSLDFSAATNSQYLPLVF